MTPPLKFLTVFTALSLMACSSPKTSSEATAKPEVSTTKITGPVSVHRPGTGQTALPRAVIYKTNINVNDHVTITLTPNRNDIVTYPAPSDVGNFSTPIVLKDGWLLDRRGGIGPNTVFLTYTYSEYAALNEAPSRADLMRAIIPEARVIDVYRLDLTLNRALSDTTLVNNIISQGLPGTTPITYK